jgi:peptide/nickel transport system substrate-binding protein
MFSSFKTDQLLSLRSWPGYWDAANRKLGGIDLIQTARGAPSVTALTSGTIDMVDLSVDDAGSLESRPGFVVSRALSDSDLMMPVCQSKPPFDKLAARQALEYAVNRADLKKAAFGDASGAVTDSLLPTTSPLYTKPSAGVDYQFDPAKAKQLLAQAGVAPGTTIEVMIPNTSGGVGPASEVLQAELRDVGLTLKISTGANFLADLNRIVPNIVLLANKLSAVSFWVTPGGGPNYCKYSNAQLTTAINAASSAKDDVSKTGWIDEQSIYRADIPIVFLANVPVLSGHTDKVQGITIMHSQAAGPLWRTIFIKK